MAVEQINFIDHLKEVVIEKPSDKIIKQIHELISQEVLKPGEKLPSERILAESFGVGRSHVREALKKLEFYGVLETLPQSGTFVAGLGVKAIEGLLKNILKLNSYDFKSIVETRAILEIEAIKLTCERATDKEIEEIEAVHIEFHKKVLSNEAGLDEDLIFHLKIAECCKNSVLYSLISLLTPDMLKLSHQKKSCEHNRYKKAFKEHQLIVEALKLRNSKLCVEYVKNHMENTLSCLQG